MREVLRVEKKKLMIIGADVSLDTAEFHHVSLPSKEDEMNVEQQIDIVECTETAIHLKMTRKVSTSKEHQVFVLASAVANFQVSEDSIEHFKDLEEMRAYVEKQAGILADQIQMGAELSRIIANLTGTFGRPPIILPPIINEKTMM